MTKIDFVACVTLKRKKGVPLDLFHTYWRDVHGPIAARIPGMHDYYQHHLAYDEGGAWQFVPGINYDFPEADRFDGLGEGTFATEDDVQKYFTGAGGVLMKDEPNLFEETVVYTTNGSNSKTYVDGIKDESLHGISDRVKFIILFKKADTVSIEDFRRYIAESFAPALVESGHVVKLRLHLLDEHDNTSPPNESELSQSVSHYKPLEKQYQALLEIAFTDRLEMSRFFASSEYVATVKEQPSFIRQIHTFVVCQTYTLIADGKLTLAGLRGYHEAELITRIGAVNQLEDDVVNLMLGKK